MIYLLICLLENNFLVFFNNYFSLYGITKLKLLLMALHTRLIKASKVEVIENVLFHNKK